MAFGRAMEELPPVASEGHVRDDVRRLAGVASLLERAVVVGGDHQRLRQALFAQERRPELGEEPVDAPGAWSRPSRSTWSSS